MNETNGNNCVDGISRDGSVVLWSRVATVLVWLVLCGALWFLFFICMVRCGSLWFCVGPGERLRFLVLTSPPPRLYYPCSTITVGLVLRKNAAHCCNITVAISTAFARMLLTVALSTALSKGILICIVNTRVRTAHQPIHCSE